MENANLTKELAPIKTQISKTEAAANQLQIKTKDDLSVATEILSRIRIIGKKITEKKESITKPLNEALRNARAFFAPIESQWINAEKTIKNKMVIYQTAELEKSIKKTAIIEKKVEEGKMSFDSAAEKLEEVIPQKTIDAKSGSVQFRTIKEVVIEDETKLPREYLLPDMVKIRKVALAGIKIDGVKVIDKQVVAGITNK